MNHREILLSWVEFEIPITQPREYDLDLSVDFVICISGPRRSGKTYLCFQKMSQLLASDFPRSNLLYINFEDDRLNHATSEDLEQLYKLYLEIVNPNTEFPIYFFLDEIQNVLNWDQWIRRMYDTHKDIKYILTGSSSKLLSQEIATSLRGRTLNYEVYPLSFREYLTWVGITYDLNKSIYGQNVPEIKRYFTDYLIKGGYPAILLNPSYSTELLQNYYDSVLFHDIIERYSIKEPKKLKILASFLFESIAKEYSYSRLAHKFQSINYPTGKSTIIEFIDAFESAYFFFQVIKYEYSQTKQLGAIKKLYCVDTGMINQLSFKFMEDYSRSLENVVFLELKRQGKKVFYSKNGYECDFLIQEKDRVTQAIQVTELLTEDNSKREFEGLKLAIEKFQLNEGFILTRDQMEDREYDGVPIHIIPVWYWLLQPPIKKILGLR